MLTWLLAAVQMFFLNPLAPLPDVAAVMKTSRRACRQNTRQYRAVQVFSPMNLSLWRWIGSRRRSSAEILLGSLVVPEDDL